MDTSIELDDTLEAFVGALAAGLVLIFVVLPIARRFDLLPEGRRRRHGRRRRRSWMT